MAQADNPYQNAHAEPFWSRLKVKMVEDGCFINIQDARDELFNYIVGHRGAGIVSCVGYIQDQVIIPQLILKTNSIKLFN